MIIKIVILTAIFSFLSFLLRAIYLWLKNIKLVTGLPNTVEAVGIHTYKPGYSVLPEIPKRGQVIAKFGYDYAKKFNVPLVLSVGNTVPDETLMECEIYRNYIFNNYNNDIKIIVGSNPGAIDTSREVRETFNIINTLQIDKFGVMALIPHLVWRIIPFWLKANSDQTLKLYFDGPLGPPKYILWEFAMMVLETFMPPNSWLRNLALKIGQRHG